MLQRGGARNYFPLPAFVTNGESLARNVDFYSISAHGSLNGNVFMVPEDTYILFMGAAGMPIYRRAHQLPVFRDYRFLRDGETEAAWYERQAGDIQNRRFFSNYLYRSGDPYAPNTTAIYEPGDIVQDLTLSFDNDAHPFMLLGVWNCPINHELSEQYDETNQQIQIAKEELTQATRELEEIRKRLDEIKNNHAHIPELLDMQPRILAARTTYEAALARYQELNPNGKALQDALPGHENNIAFKMGLSKLSEATLHEVINKTPISKRIRFFVVEACRSLGDARLVNQRVLGHVMGVHRQNFEHNKPIRNVLAEYETKARMKRRASLLARHIEPAAAAAAGGGGAGGGGAAAAAVTYVTPSFTYNIRSISRIPEAAETYRNLMSGRSIKLDALEAALAKYTAPSQALIDADIDAIIAGLAPQKQFRPRDFVKVSPTGAAASDFDAIVLGPVIVDGRVFFDVVKLTQPGPKIVKVSPLLMKRSDEDPDEFNALILSYGFDINAEIERRETEYLQARQAARAANVEFGQGLPPEVEVPRVNLVRHWPGAYATNSDALTAEWSRVGPAKHFKKHNRVKIVDSSKPEFKDREATVKGIGIIPVGTHKGKLMYHLEFNDGSKKPQVANALEFVGGQRKPKTRRHKVRRPRRRNATRKH